MRTQEIFQNTVNIFVDTNSNNKSFPLYGSVRQFCHPNAMKNLEKGLLHLQFYIQNKMLRIK